MKNGMIGVLVVLSLFFLIGQAAEAKTGMRCGGALINVGDSFYKLYKNCGNPDLKSTYIKNKETYTKMWYEKHGRTYTLTVKEGTVINITARREGA